ncbi:MAG: YbhN family protein [bacterium]
MNKVTSKQIFNIISIIVTIVVFFFLVLKLSKEFSKIDFKSLHFNMHLLALSFAFVPIWFSLLSLAYKFILSKMNESISLINSMRVIGLSTFGRYIPGKVWFTVGRTILAERLGISKRRSFTAVIVETFYLVLTGLTFFLISYGYISNNSTAMLLLFPVAYIAISLVNPSFFSSIMNFFLVKFKKEPIEFSMELKDIFILNGIYTAMWLAFGLQFLFLVKSIGVSANSVFLISVYPISWVLGFIVIFIPSGIGIREGVMVFLLSHSLSGSIALTISILSRIQMTLSELLFLFTLIKSDILWRKNEKS